MAWQQEEADRCPGCGKSRHESFNEALEDHWHAQSLRCFACKARDHERERFTGEFDDTAGLYQTVMRD